MDTGTDNNIYRRGDVLVINKPLHWTSFDLVKKVRYLIDKHTHSGKLKVGHAGTLDPLATGVMILCTGRATKRISEFQEMKKEYLATLELGKTTPSFDRETKVDSISDISHISEKQIQDVLGKFTGEQYQVPPIYSAKNIQGDRAYALARKGEKVNLPPVRVMIDEIVLLAFYSPFIKLRVLCGKGTYVRALARDIGKALGSGAFLTDLVRTRIGPYSLDDAMSIEDFEKKVQYYITKP